MAVTKLYIPVVILSTQDNTELTEQLKTGLMQTINWNKYQSKVFPQAKNQYWNYFIDLSFQRAYRSFVLLLKDNPVTKRCTQYCLLKVKIKDCSVMIGSHNFCDQTVKNNTRIYDNIQKIVTGQGDDYTTGCLLDIFQRKLKADCNRSQ